MKKTAERKDDINRNQNAYCPLPYRKSNSQLQWRFSDWLKKCLWSESWNTKSSKLTRLNLNNQRHMTLSKQKLLCQMQKQTSWHGKYCHWRMRWNMLTVTDSFIQIKLPVLFNFCGSLYRVLHAKWNIKKRCSFSTGNAN